MSELAHGVHSVASLIPQVLGIVMVVVLVVGVKLVSNRMGKE